MMHAKAKLLSCVVVLTVALVGPACMNRSQFVALTSETYSQRHSSWDEIELFTAVPDRPFIEIGLMQGRFDAAIRTPQQNVNKLRKRAMQMGADAIANLKCDPGDAWGGGRCQGTAIRYE